MANWNYGSVLPRRRPYGMNTGRLQQSIGYPLRKEGDPGWREDFQEEVVTEPTTVTQQKDPGMEQSFKNAIAEDQVAPEQRDPSAFARSIGAQTPEQFSGGLNLSSLSEPESSGRESFTLGKMDVTPGKTTWVTTPGGKLVDARARELETAQTEMDEATKSGSSTLALILSAMFPQFGSALAMRQQFKNQKYVNAKGKYDSTFGMAIQDDAPPDQMSVDGGVWDKTNQRWLVQPPEDRRGAGQEPYENFYAEGPDGPIVKRARKSEYFEPYATVTIPLEGPTPEGPPLEAVEEKYPYYTEKLYNERKRGERITENLDTSQGYRLDRDTRLQSGRIALQAAKDAAREKLERLQADLKPGNSRYFTDAIKLLEYDKVILSTKTSPEDKLKRVGEIAVEAEKMMRRGASVPPATGHDQVPSTGPKVRTYKNKG